MAALTIEQAFHLALARHQAGRLAEAEAIYRQILAVQPQHPDALHYMGVIAHQAGRNDLAVRMIRQAIALFPNNPNCHSNLGVALKAQGKFDEAISACRRAIQLKPDYAEAHNNLGAALREQGHFAEAVVSHRKALQLQPDLVEAHNNLGVALTEQQHFDEAIGACRRAIQLNPGYADAHYNLGNALKGLGRLDEAIAAFRRAIEIDPDDAMAHNNIANAFKDQGQLKAATAHYRRAIALKPDDAGLYSNLATVFKDQALLEEAMAYYRRAIALKPDDAELHSNLVFALNYHPGCDAPEIAAEHRRWSRLHAEPLLKTSGHHTHERTPGRRLRIGYVSSDFREHSVAYFLENVLACHDTAQFEIFCYSSVARSDAVTARLKGLVPHWRDIFRMPDEEAAKHIRKDRIDILVDLSGHTAHDRLMVFARKPAPVQVTWLGYPNTTGMTAMDYRLTDTHADPPGMTEPFHSERLIRLPDCAWCFHPSEDSPPVSDAPVSQRSHITFGCFNASPKINVPLLKLWAEILLAMPGSRLLHKSHSLSDATLRERIQSVLGNFGITEERIELIGRAPEIAEHLGYYSRVDVALDTFPYHGTTTTCEALWMGVPVVTLAGKMHASRVGVSLLTNVGHSELIAQTHEQYVSIATALAGDVPRLAELRRTLRQRMQASPLMDAPRFACDIEAAYRKMWVGWCAAQQSAEGK